MSEKIPDTHAKIMFELAQLERQGYEVISIGLGRKDFEGFIDWIKENTGIDPIHTAGQDKFRWFDILVNWNYYAPSEKMIIGVRRKDERID